MDHVLLIHAGIPKTGTTSLQRFLYENRDNLERHGWSYPDLRREFSHLSIWPEDFIKNGIFYENIIREEEGISYRRRGDLNIDTESWDEIWERILEGLKKRNVIISDESLWYDIDRFLLGAKKKYPNIKVVVYLRRQDRAAESMWNQRVKGRRHCRQTLWEFIETDAEEKNIDSMEGFHYLKRLNRIGKIIGDNNIIVRAYEKQQFREEHGLEADFLSILGIEPNWKEWKNFPIENAGLTGNYVELKRIFNFIQPEEYVNAEIFGLEDEFVKLAGIFGREETLFSDEQRKEFLAQFEEENKEIAKRYLHRENGVLFYEGGISRLKKRQYQCTPFEEDVVRVFSAMLCTQYKDYIRLKEHCCTLAEKMVLHKRSGRKIALFGAGQKCASLLNWTQLPVTKIVDNNKEKDGRRLSGVEIEYTGSILDWSEYFVIVTCVQTGEIERQLEGLGMEKERDYILAKEYFVCY